MSLYDCSPFPDFPDCLLVKRILDTGSARRSFVNFLLATCLVYVSSSLPSPACESCPAIYLTGYPPTDTSTVRSGNQSIPPVGSLRGKNSLGSLHDSPAPLRFDQPVLCELTMPSGSDDLKAGEARSVTRRKTSAAGGDDDLRP